MHTALCRAHFCIANSPLLQTLKFLIRLLRHRHVARRMAESLHCARSPITFAAILGLLQSFNAKDPARPIGGLRAQHIS